MSENERSVKSRNEGDSAVSVNEKGRNKRKFLSDQLTIDLTTEVSNLSLTEFPRYEGLAEKFRNAVDEWRTIVQRSDDATEEEGSEDSEWDDPIASELEQLLTHNIFTTFITAIKKIIECGFTEQVAEWAILNSSFLHGNKDAVSNVVDPALAFLKKQKEFNTPKHSVFEGLENLVDYTLLEMIFVLREVRPDLTVAEAMWALLINDLNLLNACTMERGPIVPSSREASTESRIFPQCISETAISPHSESKNSGDPQQIMASKAPVTSRGNQQSTFKPDGGESAATQKESSLTLLEAKGNSSSVDEKSGGSKKGSSSNSKRDLLRQKTFQFDKSYRGRLSKGAFKARVAAWGSMVLDKSLKSQSGSSSASVKGTSSKIAAPPVEGNGTAPAKIGTDSSLKSEISVSDAPKEIDYCASIPFDETLQKHIPRDVMDEAILMLVYRKQSLEKEVQVWTDWGNGKVMQVARRLGKDRAELKMLKQEKEEMEKYKKDKQALEENTMKRLSEMEYALSNATGQIEVAKRTVLRLEEENDALKYDMEAAKKKAQHSAAKLEEALAKEQEYQKRLQTWEAEKGLALEQLTNLKRQAAALSSRVEKAKARRDQFETLYKQEEKEKLKAMKEREALARKREGDNALTEVEAERIKQMAELDMKKYDEDIKNLQNMISKMRLKYDKSRIAALNVGYGNFPGTQLAKHIGAGDVVRERECVMCMTDEIAVVFLPCAHQVLCVNCSALHEKQGMNDCPSCRTTIQRRVTVTYCDN
ncbi:hypothetical protein ACS0TY_012991 [Phlomoides rotata]